jgi:hypothetical protein
MPLDVAGGRGDSPVTVTMGVPRWFLLFFFKIYKWAVRLVTGKSELQRIVEKHTKNSPHLAQAVCTFELVACRGGQT